MSTQPRTLIRTLCYSALALLATLSLSACIQSQSLTAVDSQDPQLAEQALKRVNHSFKTSFMMGDWYYQGAQVVKGGINAYIQIPAKLDMELEYQRNYLRQSVCPSAAQQEFWQGMGPLSLSVHIYTFNKKFSVHAECTNPLA